MKQFLRFMAVCLSTTVLIHSMLGFATASEITPAILDNQLEETEAWEEMQAVSSEVFAFFAEDAAHAQEIANSMGAHLVSYQYGIGTLCFTNTYALRPWTARERVTLYPEYDYYVEETQKSGEQADNSLDQWHLPMIHADEAWEISTGRGVLVAVIDTGIDMGHEDLAGAITAAETAIPDDYYGELSMFPEEYQGGKDNLGHGTHVAGVIGARKNQFGCTGIAPESSILSIKALERSGTQGRGKSSWVAAAINLAVERGADIINLSLGGTLVKDELLLASIDQALDAGVAVVCAAGNTASPVLMYPAAYEGTIAVSAVKPQGDFVTFASGYSNSGTWIDVAAPGSNILSTVPGGYEKKTGTSMACPMVSGALALMLSADPLLTTDQATEILYRTAQDLGESGKDSWYGHGLLDLQAMSVQHQQMLQPDTPVASIPSGRILFRNTPVDISTNTLHGKVLYTLDGSEPTEDSAVWPDAPMVFPDDRTQVTIIARTRCGDGTLGESVSFSYRFVPEMTEIIEDFGTITDMIPSLGSILDPVLQRPCRRYRITVKPDYELELVPSGEMTGVGLFLFDADGSDASRLASSASGEELIWKNDSGAEKTVFLSLVLMGSGEMSEDIPYSFRFSKQEIPPELTPEETEPKETQPAETVPKETQPKETQPKETQPKETQPKETEPKATEPADEQEDVNPETEETEPLFDSDTEPTEDIALPTIFQDYEEDWLYTMEEPIEEGGMDTMEEFDYRFLLAGGVIALFGLGLLLLGILTGRKVWLLIRDGETATATVLKISRCTDDLASQNLRATSHYTYRYQVSYRTKNGRQITAFWNEYPHIRFTKQHPVGSRLTVKYLPESPEQFMVTQHSTTMLSSLVCIVIGTAVIALGIWVAYLIATLI